jgi:hypothetical protein
VSSLKRTPRRKKMKLKLNRQKVIEPSVTTEVVTETHGSWSKGWVARISPPELGDKYDFKREFLKAEEEKLSRAGNGLKTYRNLPAGIYEADSVYRSYKSHRVYFSVTSTGVIKIIPSKTEALEALTAESPQ